MARTEPRLVVLDTNIVSYLIDLHPTAALYRKHLVDNRTVISSMVVGEMVEGARRARWGVRRLRHLASTLAGYDIIPFDAEVAEHWGRIRAERRRQPISARDAIHAATAIALGAPLVTNDPHDYQGITGLEVITEADRIN